MWPSVLDDDQEIIVYDTSATINVTNNQLETNVVYSVAAVNVIGQDPISQTTLCKCF